MSASRSSPMSTLAVIAVIAIVFATIALVTIAMFVFAPNRQPASWPAALSATSVRG